MSKRLTFADGYTLDVSDTSSVTAMSLTVGTFAAVDAERAEFTPPILLVQHLMGFYIQISSPFQ